MSYIVLSDRISYMETEFIGDHPALGYIKGDRYSFAVDTGASETHLKRFYAELEKRNYRLPDFTGISHFHWDHSYAAAFVHGVTIASDLCARELEKEAGYVWTLEAMKQRYEDGTDHKFTYYSKLDEYPDVNAIRVVTPDIEIKGDMTIDLGGVHVVLLYCGGPHSDDHLMFYVPEEKFLFVSDASGKELLTLDWDYDEKHPERVEESIVKLPYNREKLIPFLKLLKNLDFEKCLLGHAPEVLTKEELIQTLESYL